MKTNKGIGGHQLAVMKSDEWLTPPEIIQALGSFDLDPCAPVFRPWPTADHHFTIEDNGLIQQWYGRVWLNPPYGRYIQKWMQLMATHNNGIALTFARTETQFFHQHVFSVADSIFFFEGRINFYTVAGTRSAQNAGAPSVLIAYGGQNSERISEARLKGRHLPINIIPVIVVGISPTWKAVVKIAVSRLKGEAHLQEIYDLVERIAPDKVNNNRHFKEKVRQTLQTHFNRIKKGYYSTTITDI